MMFHNRLNAGDYSDLSTLYMPEEGAPHKERLEVIIIDTPETINERFGVKDFAAGYIGYYVCNGAVIMQKFGDRRADNRARKVLEKAFPERTVEQIAIDGIASGGGSIHCTTQQEIV